MEIVSIIKRWFRRPARVVPSSPDPNAIWLYFRCERCGAVVRVRVDLRNDLNREEEGESIYLLHKEVMDNSCFRLIAAEIWFDANYNIAAAYINGGELISSRNTRQRCNLNQPDLSFREPARTRAYTSATTGPPLPQARFLHLWPDKGPRASAPRLMSQNDRLSDLTHGFPRIHRHLLDTPKRSGFRQTL